jgi:2-succinyl-6-hydroxy-2,4-cyclohexadiene-1-carboxylate synthase
VTVLLLLHGYTGRKDDWAPVIEALPATFEPLAVDLFGHDPAAPVRAPIRFEDEVRRLADVVRTRARGAPAELCGYSLGGRVALVLAARYPELFRRVVLVGAAAGLESEEARRARELDDERWCRILEEQGIFAFCEKWEQQAIFDTQRALPAAVQAKQRERRLSHDAVSLAMAMRALGLAAMPNCWPELTKLPMPVELVVGELDAKFRATGERMRSLLPRSSWHVIAGAGHNVLLERPAELAAILGAQHKSDGA